MFQSSSFALSHTHTHAHTDAHFNHFVSCQERNVSQPRSPLIPGVPSLICLSLCLPSGSSLPLSPLHSIPLSYMFCYTISLSLSLSLSHTHSHRAHPVAPSHPQWKCRCQRERDSRNACCFTVTPCFLLTGTM